MIRGSTYEYIDVLEHVLAKLRLWSLIKSVPYYIPPSNYATVRDKND